MMRTNIIFIVLFVLPLLDTGINVSLTDVGGTWKIIGLDADSMSLTQVGKVYGTYNTHQGILSMVPLMHKMYGSGRGGNHSTMLWDISLRSFPMIALI